MAATYDEAGNYIYPEGFDAETGEWLPGFEAARDAWEKQYADAQKRFQAHQEQIKRMAAADARGGRCRPRTPPRPAARARTAEEGEDAAPRRGPPGGCRASGGTLASDEALQALREKLSGGGA